MSARQLPKPSWMNRRLDDVTNGDIIRFVMAGLIGGFVMGLFAAPAWHEVESQLPKPEARR